MSRWFHGTSVENAALIRHNGFRAGSFFATTKTAARHYGPVVLEIEHDNEPTPYQWHWGYAPHIGPEHIIAEWKP